MDESQLFTKSDFKSFEDRLWTRFDHNDDLSRTLGERVAVVEAQSNRNTSRLDSFTTDTKKTAAGWGAGGTAAAAFVYALISFFWKGHGQ